MAIYHGAIKRKRRDYFTPRSRYGIKGGIFLKLFGMVGSRARARGAGFHGPVKTLLLAPVKGLRDPAMMTVEQGGGG